MQQATESTVRVGPAGWSYDDWKGIVYPPRMPRSRHPLEILAPLFDTVEINASFYRPPVARNGAAWVEKVRDHPRFAFSVKLWRGFTHDREAWPGQQAVQQFCDGLAPLVEAERLGTLLVQFPWSFRRTKENRLWLARVLDAFAAYPLALEIRHASWNRPEVFEGLAERGVAFCNIDQPLFRDSLAPTEHATAPLGYVRLHGRNHDDWFRDDAGPNERYNYLYSPEELEPWVEKIRRMKKRVNDLFIVTNNHYRGQAVVNAIEIQAALGRLEQAIPEHLVAHYPRLAPLTQNAPT